MPIPIIILTGLALALRLAMGGYQIIKPSIFVAVISTAAVVLFLFCLKKSIRKPIEARMLVIAVAMPVLAWSIPSLPLLFLLMCFWVPLAAGRFSLIAPVYLFSLLLLPALDETLFIGSIKLIQFSVNDALALGAAVTIFLNPAKAKCRREWDVIAFSVVIMVAMALARDLGISHHLRVLIEISLDLALPYYIVSRGLRTGEDLRSAMLWLGAGGVTVGAILLLEVWKGWPIYNELYWHYQLPTVLLGKVRAGLIRPGGPFMEPTSAALVLAICTLALYLSRDYIRTRRHYLLLMAVALAGLIAPQSRGAWIGLCIAIAAADILRGRYVQLGQKILVLSGAISCLFIAAHSSYYLSETLGLSGGSADTNDYRRNLLSRGWEEFLHRPFFGYPMSELENRLSDMVQGEGIIDFVNAYIWVMLIAGVVGLFIFVGAFLYFLINSFRFGQFRGTARRNVEAGVFIFCTLLMLLEMFFFTSFWSRPASYLFALLGFAAAFIRLQRGALVQTQTAPQKSAGFSEPLSLKPSL
jgi:hypothetical protein